MSGKRTLHDYFSSGKKQKISDDESPVQDELQQPSTSCTSRPGLAIGQIGRMPDGPDARWAGRRSDSIDRPLIFFAI
jgi:hypothetical protein